MKSTRIPFVPLLLLTVAVSAPADSPSWPCWRDPDGNGISRETGWNPAALNGGAKVLWTADVGTGYSDVVIQDGRLYTMGVTKDGLAFSCLDAVSGTPIWTKSPFSSLEDPQSTPVVDGDKVYGLGKDGTVFCLRTTDGELVWKTNLVKDFKALKPSYGWAPSPMVDGNLLLLNALSAGIALDKRTGDPVWKSDSFYVGGVPYYASPVIGGFKGTRCVLFYGPVELCAVEIATGKKLWSWKQFYPIETLADPVLPDDKVLIRGSADILIDVGGGESRNVWIKMTPSCSLCTPVLIDGYLYTSNANQGIRNDDWGTFLKVDWV